MDRSTTGSISNKAASTVATAKALNNSPLPAPTRPGVSTIINPPGAGTNAAVTGFNANGWTAAGGSSVVMAQGENVSTLANRYGVPADAIYKSNGLTPGSAVAPGTRITVPVYRPGEAGTVATPVKSAATVTPPKAIESRPVAEAKAVTKPKMESKAAKVSAADDDDDEPVKKPVVSAKPKAVVAPAKKQAEMVKAAPAAKPVAKAVSKPVVTKPVAAKPEPSKLKQVAMTKPAKTADDDEDEDDAPVAKKPQELKAAQPKKPQTMGEKSTKPAEPKVAAAAPVKVAPVKSESEEVAKPAKQQVAAAKPAEKAEPQTTGSIDASSKPAGTSEFRWPAKGRVISGFKNGGNDGINIAVPEGTPVKAAEEGTVAYSGSELKGYGNLVLIRHTNGYVSAYAHNGELKVKKGDVVKRGQTVATSGQTGNVSSPQLHFELRKGSTPVDPSTYLQN
ncbi:MAG: peptidoglycan DD-metalloendopeptidase family protein [Beijerinckiaceae bacterium]